MLDSSTAARKVWEVADGCVRAAGGDAPGAEEDAGCGFLGFGIVYFVC